MLKRLFFVLIFLVLFASFPFPVFAQNETGEGSASSAGSSGATEPSDKMIVPPDYPISRGSVMPFAGQNHNYSLVFRGNGESIVTLRIALTNTSEDTDLSEVEFRIPKIVDPKDLSTYQILVSPPCVRYEDVPAIQIYPYTPKCAEYGEPDYYYYYGNGKYQKALAEFSGDTLKVTLPTPLEPGKIFVYVINFHVSVNAEPFWIFT